jgi:hypothetical protein
MADKDNEPFMPRRLHWSMLAVVLASAPVVFAQQPVVTTPPVSSVKTVGRLAVRAGARSQAFTTTIQGNALTSTNGQLADAMVRLRDARYGRVVDSVITDKSGLFAFHAVDPGSYIVEIVSTDQTAVLAASQILSVNAGDVISAVVKLPFRLPPFAGILGGNVAASASPTTAAALVTQAAANSVLIIATPSGATDNCSMQSVQ